MRFLFFIFSLCLLSFNALANNPNAKVKTPPEYTQWFESMKRDMVRRGISRETIDRVFTHDYYKPDPEVVRLDRRQTEFIMTATDYINRMINERRVTEAQRHFRELHPQFKDLEKKYGVGFHYLIAFWGVETNFGGTFGRFEVIDALTTLAYDKRRRKFFTEELYNALKMIDRHGFDHTKMESSWAGAMGHFQFMPSTFNAYAVSRRGDGKIDIWTFDDAVASAANYLSRMGWNRGEEWGMAVSLPLDFEYKHTGLKHIKTVGEWDKMGVRLSDGKKINVNHRTRASIIVPEGHRGQAYMVFDNFRKIMRWNRSESYALAVGLLADYVRTGRKFQALEKTEATKVKTEDVKKFQQFFNRHFGGKLSEDGVPGPKTREAVKQVQKRAKLPEDGFIDYTLLNKINNYNPKVGF
jgi:membrane-bound lytic murein transglycosylase B